MRKRSLNWRKPATALEATAARYFERRAATWAPNTIRGRRYTVLSFIELIEARFPRLHRFSQLQRAPHIEAWLDAIRHLHPVTRRNYIEILDEFLHDLIDWQWPHPPPHGLFLESDLPPMPQRLPTPFNPDADRRLRRLLQAEDSVMGLGVRVLRETGLRIGELLSLPLDAARLTPQGDWELKVPAGKTYTERLFPLSAATARLFEHIRARRGLHVPSQPLPPLLLIDEHGQPLREWTLRRYIKKLARRAGLPRWERAHPHQMRHTFATELARTDIPLPSLMALLGHKRPDVTMRYVGLTNRDIRRAYEKAVAQLTVLHHLPPVPKRCPTADTTLQEDFDALIHRLDHHRRDRSDPASRTALLRLVKRLRAARRTFQNAS